MSLTSDYIDNRTFDEIKVGDSASLTRKLMQRDIELFAVMSGDSNPALMTLIHAASKQPPSQ